MSDTKTYDYMIRYGFVEYMFNDTLHDIPIVIGIPPKFKHGKLSAYCGLQAVNDGLRVKVELDNDMGVPLKITRIVLETSISLPVNTRFFCNGYQSQSFSVCTDIVTGLKGSGLLCKKDSKRVGDYLFTNYKKNEAHSWTYTYFDGPIGYTFIGSLDESIAYTKILFEMNKEKRKVKVKIEKDLQGFEYGPVSRISGYTPEPLKIVDFFMTTGDPVKSPDNYFSLFYRVNKDKNLYNRSTTGYAWDSGYSMMDSINSKELLDIATNYSKLQIPLDYFIIGPGYESVRSDWMEPGSGFSQGVGKFSEKIKELGYSPGITFSPFVCSKKSRIFTERNELLLKDHKGKPIRITKGRGDESDLYVLDIYNDESKRYIQRCISTFIEKWGMEIIRMEDLYAASLCSFPYKNKTRAQAMNHGAKFLRDVTGDTPIIANGIPLGSAFGLFEYCSVTPDLSANWHDKLPFSFCNRFLREKPDTRNAIVTLLGRKDLNNRGFSSDGGSIIFRKYSGKMTGSQKDTLFNALKIFTGLFTGSDSLGAYSKDNLSDYINGLSEFSNIDSGKIKIISTRDSDPVSILIDTENKDILQPLPDILGKHLHL